MKFTRITEKNIELAHSIEKKIFPDYDALNNYKDSLKEGAKGEFYIIEEKGNNIGVIGLYSYDDYPLDAWLGFFGLLDEYRHQGYGAQAIQFFEGLARTWGFKYARLFTDTFDNDHAKEFYKEQGYKEEIYFNKEDPASLKYPISIFSKSLFDDECPAWNNRNIHFTKQVKKQQA